MELATQSPSSNTWWLTEPLFGVPFFFFFFLHLLDAGGPLCPSRPLSGEECGPCDAVGVGGQGRVSGAVPSVAMLVMLKVIALASAASSVLILLLLRLLLLVSGSGCAFFQHWRHSVKAFLFSFPLLSFRNNGMVALHTEHFPSFPSGLARPSLCWRRYSVIALAD